MFKLTLSDVKAAGLAALYAGKLSAQGPTPECAYRDDHGRPCVIGAALPFDVVDCLIDVGQGDEKVSDLSSNIVVTDPDELPKLARLQAIHDRWAQMEAGWLAPSTSIHDDNTDLIGLSTRELQVLLEKELTS